MGDGAGIGAGVGGGDLSYTAGLEYVRKWKYFEGREKNNVIKDSGSASGSGKKVEGKNATTAAVATERAEETGVQGEGKGEVLGQAKEGEQVQVQESVQANVRS